MKKIIPILLALLLLAGCGAAPAADIASPTETEAPLITEAPEEIAQPEASGEVPKITESTPAPETAEEAETVTLDGISEYLRLTLPEGWSCEAEKESESRRALLLTAEDGFTVEAIWWESFGMCGTGVEFTELELPDGQRATLATETSGGRVWWTLILPHTAECFTLQLGATQEELDAHQAELDALIGSIERGALAEIPPQPLADK